MAGEARGGSEVDEEPIITDINVTPLVDVVLVLLIILMVTATAIVSKTIPMELPKAETGEQTTGTLSVSVDESGTLYLDRDALDAEQFRARVRKARQEDPEVRAVIAADAHTDHMHVIRAIDLLRKEEVMRFAIRTDPKEKPTE